MNEDGLVQWTDTRVVALLLVPLIAAIALITASATPEAALVPQDSPAGAPPPAQLAIPSNAVGGTRGTTGTALWALDLLANLETYEGAPSEKYDRDTYDVGWLDIDGDCQSGRHELLILESTGPVEFTADGCRVVKGLWSDPYTGTRVTSAQDASIDHVVSLADAHRSGGWRWSDEWRVAFANDLDDPATLAVSAAMVNSAKGSAAPDQWLPEADEARCAYATAWVRVKTRWQLAITVAERTALVEALRWCDQRRLPTEPVDVPLRVVDFSETPFLPIDRSGPFSESDSCDVRYESVCIPAVTGDLDCADIEPRRFAVEADPHNFDGDENGIGCER